MVLLLALSTALAILVQPPERQRSQGQETAPEPVERPVEPRPGQEAAASPRGPDERDADRVVERSIIAGGSTERLSIRSGDRLVLEVRSANPVVLELVGTGLVDPAGPYDPARFDLLVREGPERLVVLELGTEDPRIAVIEVR